MAIELRKMPDAMTGRIINIGGRPEKMLLARLWYGVAPVELNILGCFQPPLRNEYSSKVAQTCDFAKDQKPLCHRGKR
jgi:hypothetical protein